MTGYKKCKVQKITNTKLVTSVFLLNQLREQGIPLDQLYTVFQAIILIQSPNLCHPSVGLYHRQRSSAAVVRPMQKSIGKWEIRPSVKL